MRQVRTVLAVTTLGEFLQAQPGGEGRFRFHIPRELHGAFGGAFGGVVCAATIVAARAAAPGRIPNALDTRFVRGLVAGDAFATATVIHAGRSLANVSVDLTDEAGKLCARSTISFVERSALAEFDHDTLAPGDWIRHDEADPWPPVAPIVTALDSRIVGQDERGIATAIVVPWNVSAETSAEAACMAADLAVGPPLGANVPRGIGTPNPDISLRFCGDVTTPTITGLGRMTRASGGVAAVTLEVWSGDALVCNGISTALLLPPR